MNEYAVNIYTKSEDLPPLLESDFFHSPTLFQLLEKVPDSHPCMAVAFLPDGKVAGQLLMACNHLFSSLPIYFNRYAHAYKEGIYAPGVNPADVFPLLLEAVSKHFCFPINLCIEFSHISRKMFGYKDFRLQGYVPIACQEIHNSLHSKAPEERISAKMRCKIENLQKKGITYHEATTPAERSFFHTLLKKNYRFRIRKQTPSKEYIEALCQSGKGKVLLTTYKRKLLGGSLCIFSEGNAYLWHLASLRKTYATLHPNLMTIWFAIKHASRIHCNHFYFKDIGLPWRRNPYRGFILSFGGKPVTKYRWVKVQSSFFSHAIQWLFKE